MDTELFRGEHLHRAIVLPDTDADPKPQVVLLFDDGIAVRWFARAPLSTAQTPEESIIEAQGQHGRFKPTDDLGTEYAMVGGFGSGDGQTSTGEERYTPGVPANATTLTLFTPNGLVELDLT